VLFQEALVGCGVVIGGDGDDLQVGQIALQLFEAWDLFYTGSTPACPEVEEDDVAVEPVEIDGVLAVVEGKCGRVGADLLGTSAAIAGRKGERQECCGECRSRSPL
jgi:hypothetical protein